MIVPWHQHEWDVLQRLGDVQLLEFDIHIQADANGSVQEYAK